jgi:hypothetical protein
LYRLADLNGRRVLICRAFGRTLLLCHGF